MNDKVLPFAEGQRELIETTEKLWCLRFRKSAYEKKFCDVDDVGAVDGTEMWYKDEPLEKYFA